MGISSQDFSKLEGRVSTCMGEIDTEHLTEAFKRLGKATQLTGADFKTLAEIYGTESTPMQIKVMNSDICDIQVIDPHKPKGPAIRQRKDRHLRK